MGDEGRSGSLLIERHGPVAVVRLHRPARRNALDGDTAARLGATLARLDRDPGVRAAVLTGTPPGFCAGSDLTELATLSLAGMVDHEAATGAVCRTIPRLGLPVLAAVEGFAMGGGFLLAVACDVVFSAADTVWRLPEVPFGWVPPWGLRALIDRVGPAAARRLVWNAEPVSPARLHRLGAVDEVTDPGRAEAAALRLAERLADLPAHAVASVKQVLAAELVGPAETLDARATARFGADCRTGAARAAIARFDRRVAS
ncbi:enoyl-CoA hydratase/isomerase family protein [Micromonospora sp. HNM0581]|uniref:enoyl-CoA hydratase/isomerase family protein n=1 Tax=Micromonospora sp. HNM0581 TaxID=2716341 RepID=UPI00146E6C98|nr:enoyl-CoA hydratase/isomerase family protein [Micromonospora sp. HNM0581]NLU80936.1 enoyl-CoA hydratase/isomerase family protein [Micromonospora sp. HNM0581]